MKARKSRNMLFLIFILCFIFSFAALEIIPKFFEKPAENGTIVNDGKTAIVPIFVYHSVRPYNPNESKEQDEFDITPDLLRRELQYLRDNHYTEITFDQLADYFEKNTPLPPKPVILSFDDGWHNQYDFALPLLKEFQATSTFFIFTNSIGVAPFLSLPEIKEIEKSGMAIGDHSKSHPYLYKMTALSDLEKEIYESKKILEADLGHPVTAFAYPFGHDSEMSKEVLQEVGFRTARTLFEGKKHTESGLLTLQSYLANDNFNDFVYVLNSQAK